CIINVIPKGPLDGFSVDSPAIRSELNAIGKATRRVCDKRVASAAVATADGPIDNQLRLCIQRYPRPAVAVTFAPVFRLDVLILGMNESPYLIHLDIAGGQID